MGVILINLLSSRVVTTASCECRSRVYTRAYMNNSTGHRGSADNLHACMGVPRSVAWYDRDRTPTRAAITSLIQERLLHDTVP